MISNTDETPKLKDFLERALQIDDSIMVGAWISHDSEALAYKISPSLPKEVHERLSKLVANKIHIPALVMSVTDTSGEYIGELEYVIVGRSNFQGIFIPLKSARLTLAVGIKRGADATEIVLKLRQMVLEEPN